MHKAINELPDQIQTIYELSLKGKSNEEIARVLNLSLDSVKSYKKRGKQILKEKLKRPHLFPLRYAIILLLYIYPAHLLISRQPGIRSSRFPRSNSQS